MKVFALIFLLVALSRGAEPGAGGADPAATLPEARRLYNGKNYAQASALVDEILLQEPQNPQAYLLKGLVSIKLELWSSAKEALKSAVALDPEMLPAHLQLAFLYERDKEWDGARASWNKVLELAPPEDKKTRDLAGKHLKNLDRKEKE